MITNTTITTNRRDGVGLFEETSVLSSVQALIEPVSDTKQAMFEGEFGQDLFEGFLFGSYDIAIGDKVTDASSVSYMVKNLKDFNGNPFIPPTMELILAKIQ